MSSKHQKHQILFGYFSDICVKYLWNPVNKVGIDINHTKGDYIYMYSIHLVTVGENTTYLNISYNRRG